MTLLEDPAFAMEPWRIMSFLRLRHKELVHSYNFGTISPCTVAPHLGW